uniref:Cytochrome c oxidase subunit 3 n=1 Tax=Eimeria maxima TaxID=5804 RepID=F6KZK2_EIMMA|nr:cytochrome c oxidase subunit 3 [Eimeria maxima]WEV84784.1 cytochrome c oxidase subunit 3 [Eimeria maxima]WEV84787.1 cytochrome c oxidase subunit 3 [Eimeria maxima]WEV84790.1 cytochrome c oxidase subunit 3 [Eimeria maxima]WEV84793.1 cytochrome c oxidase subunit 3 [Eimeria maxima]
MWLNFYKKLVSTCSYLRIFTKISFLYATTLRYFTVGFLFSPFLITVLVLFNYTFREVGTTSASMVSSICLGVISTELLLFISFFWGAYSSILSPSYIADTTLISPVEGLVSISNRGLIVTITFLLSSASVVLGYGVLTSEKAIVLNIQKGFLALVLIAICFTSVQICEYLGLAIYINDGVLGTYLLWITGLHFTHVLIGAILLFFTFWRGSLQYNLDNQIKVYTSSSMIVLPQLESYTILYWHFVEAIWLVIHFTFYTI